MNNTEKETRYAKSKDQNQWKWRRLFDIYQTWDKRQTDNDTAIG